MLAAKDERKPASIADGYGNGVGYEAIFWSGLPDAFLCKLLKIQVFSVFLSNLEEQGTGCCPCFAHI